MYDKVRERPEQEGEGWAGGVETGTHGSSPTNVGFPEGDLRGALLYVSLNSPGVKTKRKNILLHTSVGSEEDLIFGLESLTVSSELVQVCLVYSPACFAKWQHRVSNMLAFNKQGDRCSYIRISEISVSDTLFYYKNKK